jgi:hypothetical protein
MLNLEKRIAALEATKAPADDLTIISRYVRPGYVDAEIFSLRDDDGKLWTRQPGETEQALIDRATLEVKRTPWGIASLRADGAEAPHAEH